MEDVLILDELLLLSEMLADKHKQNFKMLASLQGVQIDDGEEDSNDELPPEIAEMERKFREEKEARGDEDGSLAPGLGYQVMQS